MAAVAGFAVYTTQAFVTSPVAATTAGNISAHSQLYTAGLVAWLVIAVLDVVVALALYVAFVPAGRLISAAAAVARCLYAGVLLLAVSHLYRALGFAGANPPDPARVVASLHSFSFAWSAGLIIFGVHLGLVGWLVWRTVFGPKWIAVLLWLAALGYVVGDVVKLATPALGASVDPIVAAPEALGELVFAIWLIIRAKRFDDWA